MIFEINMMFYRKFSAGVIDNSFFEVQKNPDDGNHAVIWGIRSFWAVT